MRIPSPLPARRRTPGEPPRGRTRSTTNVQLSPANLTGTQLTGAPPARVLDSNATTRAKFLSGMLDHE